MKFTTVIFSYFWVTEFITIKFICWKTCYVGSEWLNFLCHIEQNFLLKFLCKIGSIQTAISLPTNYSLLCLMPFVHRTFTHKLLHCVWRYLCTLCKLAPVQYANEPACLPCLCSLHLEDITCTSICGLWIPISPLNSYPPYTDTQAPYSCNLSLFSNLYLTHKKLPRPTVS